MGDCSDRIALDAHQQRAGGYAGGGEGDITRRHFADGVARFWVGDADAQGFFPAILYRELFVCNKATNGRFWTEAFVFASCMAFSGIFELIEFSAAQIWGKGADAFLGMQGDIWDAQYDILMCGIGTVLSILLLGRLHYKILVKIKN